MPVFISHKNKDSDAALKIGSYLKSEGIETYIDVFDPATKTTEDITSLILDRLSLCTHLIAVVSENTKESWWVPFEIGAASEAARRICSYKKPYTYEELPQYLTKWPIMTSPEHMKLFVRNYRSDINKKSVIGTISEAFIKSYRSDANRFHDSLKQSIRLGY